MIPRPLIERDIPMTFLPPPDKVGKRTQRGHVPPVKISVVNKDKMLTLVALGARYIEQLRDIRLSWCRCLDNDMCGPCKTLMEYDQTVGL